MIEFFMLLSDKLFFRKLKMTGVQIVAFLKLILETILFGGLHGNKNTNRFGE